MAGVRQTIPIKQTSSGSAGNSSSVSLSSPLSTLSGEMVIYATSLGENRTHTPYTGYTEVFDMSGAAGLQSASVNTKMATAAANKTISSTYSLQTNRAVIAGITLIPITSTLPIELVSFNIDLLDNKSVKLDWQTASEDNNDYFTIERSKDGHEWQEIAIVDGAGNSTSIINYSSIDNNPNS